MNNMGTCKVCGKSYKLCKVCEENQNTWAGWRRFTDTRECYKVFITLRSYNMGLATKEETIKMLKTLDLDNMIFIERIDKQIKELLAEKPKRSKKNITPEIEEND